MSKANSIIHTVPSIINEASGPSYSVVRLCESLIDKGYDLTLATLDGESTNNHPAFQKCFPLGGGPNRLGNSPAMKCWLNEQARLSKVDLIHNHSLWMMPNVYPGQVANRYDVPLVVAPRGTLSQVAMQNGSMVKRIFWPLIQKPSLQATSCFHATAKTEYDDIRRMGFQQPVAIIPNGIDIPPHKQPSNNDKRTLLFLGRLHPIKGLDVLLQAWHVVSPRFPEWNLQIAGPDNRNYLEQIQNMAIRLNLKRLEFVGPLYADVKLNAYQKADLFVLPTYSENFGMTVAEALASGTPAIVSKGAPWSSLDKNGAGWWIDIGLDPLVSVLEEALSLSSEELYGMGSMGREWMFRDYSWVKITNMMNETYQWLLGGDEKPDWVIDA